MTNSCYGAKALAQHMVLHTWSGILLDEATLPDNWIGHPRVLVGIVPLEQEWQPENPFEPP